MRILSKVMSITSYIVLMSIGFFFFILSTATGIYLIAATGDLITRIWNAIQEAIPSLDDVEPPKALMVFIIEIPFIIMSLIGLAIILLTQRTASAKRLARR